jgi:hypothetical protein
MLIEREATFLESHERFLWIMTTRFKHRRNKVYDLAMTHYATAVAI